MSKFKSFLQRKGVDMTWKAYFVDALGAMALGLFASLLIGTIFQTLGDKTGIEAFETIAKYAKAATGAAIAVAIAYKLGCEGLVLFSAIAVGIAGNELGYRILLLTYSAYYVGINLITRARAARIAACNVPVEVQRKGDLFRHRKSRQPGHDSPRGARGAYRGDSYLFS